MFRPPFSIEHIALASCEGHSNAVLYHQALVIAQCDVIILRLRATAAALLKMMEDRASLPGRTAPEEFPYEDGISHSATTVEELLDCHFATAQFGAEFADDGWYLYSYDPGPVLRHLDVLSKLENAIHLRRRRALRTLLRVRRAAVTKKGKTRRTKTE